MIAGKSQKRIAPAPAAPRTASKVRWPRRFVANP